MSVRLVSWRVDWAFPRAVSAVTYMPSPWRDRERIPPCAHACLHIPARSGPSTLDTSHRTTIINLLHQITTSRPSDIGPHQCISEAVEAGRVSGTDSRQGTWRGGRQLDQLAHLRTSPQPPPGYPSGLRPTLPSTLHHARGARPPPSTRHVARPYPSNQLCRPPRPPRPPRPHLTRPKPYPSFHSTTHHPPTISPPPHSIHLPSPPLPSLRLHRLHLLSPSPFRLLPSCPPPI